MSLSVKMAKVFCLELIQISSIRLNIGNHSTIASTEWKFFVNQDCVVHHAVSDVSLFVHHVSSFRVFSFANGDSEVSLMNDVVLEVI